MVQHLEVVSGSDVSILALAEITKQNKKFWVAIGNKERFDKELIVARNHFF